MTIEDGIRTDKLTREEVERGESSHAKLLGMVRPGSRVLECGPQNGIMTRYLKEELGCQVYIVEIDPQCFQKASAYADGGVCASLEDDGWLERFEHASFDYILYADVLEHLHDPLAVLMKMRRFLKEDGSALLSVPNVAHGDVLMNLLCDQFNYLTPGLLAPEHIHLFALESIREMIRRAGYYAAYEGATYAPLFHTEQGPFIPESRRDELKQIIRDHATKEAYQFVFRLSTRETQTLSDVEKALSGQGEVRSRFYFDCYGKGFTEAEKAEIIGKRKEDGRVVYQVPLPQGCEAVRYDPLEGQCCLLEHTVTTVDGQAVKADVVNGVKLSGGGHDALWNPRPADDRLPMARGEGVDRRNGHCSAWGGKMALRAVRVAIGRAG